MTKSFLTTILAIVMFPLLGLSVPPKELHLGLSPFLPAAHRQAIAQQLPEVFVKTLPGGSRVVVWDAWRLVIVTDFTIPTLKMDSPQARAPHLVKPLTAIGQWLRSAALMDAEVPRDLAAVKAPEWLELLSRASAAGPRSILILGSPLYLNPTEPTFSMTESRYPADGHLAVTLTESVFGLREKTNRLANSSVHWCYFTEQLWKNELHRTAITRFWGLFVQGQNGCLASFGADLSLAIANSLQVGLPPCGRFVFDPEAEKLEMRTAVPRTFPLWLQKISTPATNPPTQSNSAEPSSSTPLPVKATSEPSPAVSVESPTNPPAPPVMPGPILPQIPSASAEKPAPLTAPAEATAPVVVPNPLPIEAPTGKIGIGILWDTDGVDLDLYVRGPGASELNYRNTRNSLGHYYFDYRNRNSHLDYEYVELDSSIDLNAVTAWVNYYQGNASKVTGKVCVHYQGRTFLGDFSMQASRGNRGSDSSRRQNSPYWTPLNLHDLLNATSGSK